MAWYSRGRPSDRHIDGHGGHADFTPLPPKDPFNQFSNAVIQKILTKFPFISQPVTIMIVVTVDPVLHVLTLKRPGDSFANGYHYPYLDQYVPYVGDYVIVVKFPQGPVVIGLAAGGASVPTVLSVFMGSTAGTSSPFPVLNGTNNQGVITFGTGGGAGSGPLIQVTFSSPLPSAFPAIQITAQNSVTQALSLYVVPAGTLTTTISFDICSHSPPLSSQTNTTYAIGYTTSPGT